MEIKNRVRAKLYQGPTMTLTFVIKKPRLKLRSLHPYLHCALIKSEQDGKKWFFPQRSYMTLTIDQFCSRSLHIIYLKRHCGWKIKKREHMVWTSILHVVHSWTTYIINLKILLSFCSMWIFNTLSWFRYQSVISAILLLRIFYFHFTVYYGSNIF